MAVLAEADNNISDLRAVFYKLLAFLCTSPLSCLHSYRERAVCSLDGGWGVSLALVRAVGSVAACPQEGRRRWGTRLLLGRARQGWGAGR